ncbi:hypothetical protein KIN20_019283 [Parelaphostrongylus tenuis]|uniref:Uncharacterized protein n=1 Tax=Parelaphostrongylus tenuis TaxID=148309 RepID=A0AAD5QSQ5_PARTN|nr:hypothetical protein KIN20_019283 [Parelaphostrongylus tenuis]
MKKVLETNRARPREADRQAVLETIEENPSLTSRMLADDLDCDHKTIERATLRKAWSRAAAQRAAQLCGAARNSCV